MRSLVSAFAGIGGFELAGERVGLKPTLSCEIDGPARKVLSQQFSSALVDDVTTLDASEPFATPCAVLTAGSPCQDFSIAGLRGGLAGSRSGLFEHVIRLRDELNPRFVVWENVPGALTSNKGKDFANVIGALVGSPEPLPLPRHPKGRVSRYAGIAHGPAGTLAWRVLDAQHFGVPQRRQRIFAVLDTQGWESISVLFPGHFAPTGLPWVVRGDSWAMPLDDERVPFDTGMAPPEPVKVRLAEILEQDVDERYYLSEKACKGILRRAEKRGRALPPILDHALRCQAGEAVDLLPEAAEVHTYRQVAFGHHVEDELTSPVLARDYKGSGGVVVEPLALSQNSRDEVRTSEVAPALSCGGGKPGQGYSAVLEPAYAIHGTQDPIYLEDTALTLESRNAPYSGVVCDPPLYRVRRLTPLECERLQGFPDGWTAIEGAKDSQRYRQLGNAVAVPVAEWVLGRIAQVLD